MKAQEFDEKFDAGAVDIVRDLDMTTARRPRQRQRSVNVAFPTWMIDSLDKEAARIGVTRQSIIKLWLSERLDRIGHKTDG